MKHTAAAFFSYFTILSRKSPNYTEIERYKYLLADNSNYYSIEIHIYNFVSPQLKKSIMKFYSIIGWILINICFAGKIEMELLFVRLFTSTLLMQAITSKQTGKRNKYQFNSHWEFLEWISKVFCVVLTMSFVMSYNYCLGFFLLSIDSYFIFCYVNMHWTWKGSSREKYYGLVISCDFY